MHPLTRIGADGSDLVLSPLSPHRGRGQGEGDFALRNYRLTMNQFGYNVNRELIPVRREAL